MVHEMKLNPQPFLMIAKGDKTVELRLYDEKRRRIMPADVIIFINVNNPESRLSATVKKLHVFDSFKELYESLPLDRCGYMGDDLLSASYEDMNAYYSPEEQQRFGVVGIEIENVKVL